MYSKYKIPEHQNGHAYLTSHRICYVDNAEPRKNSVGVDLKDVERFEYYVCSSSYHKVLQLKFSDKTTGRLS